MTIDRYIGSKLSGLRTQLDVDPERVAAYLSIPLETYGAFELGVRHIPAGSLFDLCCFFDVPVTHFFDGYEQSHRDFGKIDEYPA